MSQHKRCPDPAEVVDMSGGAAETVAAEVLGPVGVEHPQADRVAFPGHGKDAVAADPELAVAHANREFGELEVD
jgi:hypothetical protein